MWFFLSPGTEASERAFMQRLLTVLRALVISVLSFEASREFGSMIFDR